MAKAKISWELISWGIYSHWDKSAKALPDIEKITDTIPCILGIEFGYVLNIKKAKGKKLSYTIDHPPFAGSDGKIAPPFTGDVYVKQNNWDFFLGDTIWEPIDDKLGPWRLITQIDSLVLADETLMLVEEKGDG